MPSILKRSDYDEYLLRLYFGPKKDNQDYLFWCCRRPYGDFQRTLHGIGKLSKSDEARHKVYKTLNQELTVIRKTKTPTQDKFDDWHRRTCKHLAKIYRDYRYRSFTVGQAQKWLNMALKYIYVIGDQRLPGFAHLYDFCHVPLDKILIDRLRPYGFPLLPCAWSRLDDYDIYLNQQRWVRKRFKSLAPLDVEFRLWMHQPLPQHN